MSRRTPIPVLLSALMATFLPASAARAGEAPAAAPATPPIASSLEPSRIWSPTLSEKNQRRVLKRCDRTFVTFLLSEPGEWSKARDNEDMGSVARYAARKVLSSQIEALRPEILDVWRESAVSLVSGRTHGGEVRGGGGRPVDLDVGFRAGKPFVGTHLGGARVTLEHDLRRGRTTLAATRRFGDVGTRFEIRYGDEDEARVSLSIPVSW